MKTILSFLIALFFAGTIKAQCYSVSQMVYNHNTLTSPTSVTMGDDFYSNIIQIGFPFCFYGASYTSLVIGANGVLRFDTIQASQYCPWQIGAAIPSTTIQVNSILFPIQDLYSIPGGTMSYQTIGSSPNRKFIVDFDSIPMYFCQTTFFSGQVKLIETTNAIEMHITQKSICAQWNGGYAIEGVQNSLGTSAIVVPGRNWPTVWTATNDAWRFMPSCVICSGVGISESPISELNVFVSDHNQITIIPNGQDYKLLEVYNMLGQEINFTQSENIISLENPNSGIYIVNLEVNGTHVAKKVVMN